MKVTYFHSHCTRWYAQWPNLIRPDFEHSTSHYLHCVRSPILHAMTRYLVKWLSAAFPADCVPVQHRSNGTQSAEQDSPQPDRKITQTHRRLHVCRPEVGRFSPGLVCTKMTSGMGRPMKNEISKKKQWEHEAIHWVQRVEQIKLKSALRCHISTGMVTN